MIAIAGRLRGAGIASDKIALELVEGLEGKRGGIYNRLISLALNKLPENTTEEEALKILGETLDHEVSWEPRDPS